MSSKVVKIAMVGSGGAGKTTIASRLATGEFKETMMTAGLNIETWSIVDEDNDQVKATIFDLGGQSQFRFFQSFLLGGTNAVLIVLDLTQFKSMGDINDWIPLIEHIPKDKWILVGNKVDEESSIQEEDVLDKAEELGIKHIIISAKTGENFEALVAVLSKLILSQN